MNDIGGTRSRLIVGDWEVRASTLLIARDDCEVRLTPRTMDVLVYLAQRAGETVSQRELLTAFWRGAISSPNAVHKSIAELRHAFGDAGDQPVYVETVPKRGYRLVAKVERLEVANGTSRTENATPPNGEARTVAASSIDGSAIVPRSSRLRWVAFGSLIVVVVSTIAFLRADNVEGFVFRIGDQSAVLLPVTSSSPALNQHFLDGTRDKVVAQLRARGLTDVSTAHRSNWIGGAIESAGAWNADYAVRIHLSEAEGRLGASLSIIPDQSTHLAHHEEFDVPIGDRLSLLNTLVSHATEDLAVLLNEDMVVQMREWGTSNADAYRLAREGDTFQLIQTPESQNYAADLFRQSLREDPSFEYAYVSLATVYETLFLTPTDTADRELLRRTMQALAREARASSVDADTLGELDRKYRGMSAGNVYDAEEQWRTELIENPMSFEALNHYGRLLAGAKLIAEGRRYIDRCIALAREAGEQGWAEYSTGNYATHAEAQGDFQAYVLLLKQNLNAHPDGTSDMFGLVRALAKLGRYAEAEAYLTRLQQTNEMWGYAASVWLSALRGDIPLGSKAQQEAFSNPLITNAMRGNVCFMLGDVDCGVRYWRMMEPGYLPIYWEFGPGNEVYWAPGVLSDARYRKLVNELGWGSEWRRYIREKAAELTSITGIEITSPPPPEDLSISES